MNICLVKESYARQWPDKLVKSKFAELNFEIPLYQEFELIGLVGKFVFQIVQQYDLSILQFELIPPKKI